MSHSQYIVFGKPNLAEEEIDAVTAVLRSGWIGTGPRVQEFQKRFAEYIGTKHAVAVGSCTAALHLAMEAIGVSEGDEVITTPMTFAATANAIVHAGATPVFADVKRDTMNIDPGEVERRITPRTKAILPVHFAGRPCEMDQLRAIANRRGLVVIEDAAHAIESRYRGAKIGTLGDVSCFSFYVTKNMTTAEGGMLCTNQDPVASKVRIYGLHGMSADAWSRFSDQGYKHYDVVYTGYKYNMTDIQAALGLVQLPKVAGWLERRKQIWAMYDAAFARLPLRLPAPEEPNTIHARHLYTLLIDAKEAGISRDQFMVELHKRGIGTGVHYRALHTHSYYRERFNYQPDDYPNANWIGERTVSIPLQSGLSDTDVERIIRTVIEVIKA
jgi:dTDP-4-amino-4,6-dideoxygalactose transaminase